MRKYFIALSLTYFVCISAIAQQKPAYWDDVQAIKHFDAMYKAPVNPVLFVGSSSIRKWDDLTQVFAKYNGLNRGIGGAVINDITFYLNDIVFPYNPKQIVLYVGENDLPDAKVTPDTVLNRTINLYKSIRAKLPNTPIVYISIKPSPSRDKFREKAIASNQLIQKFLAGEQNVVFVDIYKPMLTKTGQLRPELFLEDMLHMNPAGYAIWRKAIERKLIKNQE
ncbi:GDSL-type esterase/lipase family protein [Pedobacter punctiformis]|uniref:GDSL-type esterase/lipase family protein n=1 Tax=Pedobacter punctiformis TaxID=3004097 RepID=A0ABT4LBK3_9SPHI|nr:GDSL-type esterase/lipase family protein [Pedobacter sp. HCMS5-2]MCZ4245308.1 GDSL-type esterase/lipase family protein [Pedobacter sp. HCMS5-2]